MGKGILSLCIVFLCSSWCYGFISAPLDSPVVVDYTEVERSTGLNGGRGTARDSRGWIYAVYAVGSNPWSIRCSRSTDNGRTWSWFADITRDWGLFPNIVIDRGDSIYVNWEREDVDTLGHDIFFSKYNGGSWTPPVNVSNQHAHGTTESSSLALDGNENLHLTWLTGDVWYSYYTNNVWSTPENVTQGAGPWVASMCADTASNLHLAWQGWQIMYKKHSGGVWEPTEQASPMRGGQPCIVSDLLCRPHVTFVDSGYVAYSMRDSMGWIPPRRISDTLGNFASITCDKYGHLYVVWYGPDIAKGKLYYATYDGTAWSPPVRLRNDTANGDYDPRLGFPVSDGGVDLIWTMNNPSGSGYRVMYWRLPLLPVGVEGEGQKALKVEGIKLEILSPARRVLRVSYALPVQGKISLILYDLSGRKVALLEEGVRLAGRQEVEYPLALPSGVYFLRLESGQASLTRKVVMIR